MDGKQEINLEWPNLFQGCMQLPGFSLDWTGGLDWTAGLTNLTTKMKSGYKVTLT